MTTYHAEHPSVASAPPIWLRVLLGIVLIVGGIFVLGNIATATLISTFLIGCAAVVVGVFEIVHAFWTKGWGGFLWQILLGAFYALIGLLIINRPIAGALALTLALSIVFIASGIARVVLGIKRRQTMGWVMILSGVLGVIAGLIVLTGWPVSGIWVLGLLLGVDLISSGIAWLMYASVPAERPA